MYAFTQDLPITAAVYARIMEGVGTEPPAGCIVHAVVRIDEVSREGTAKITSVEGGANVTPFPMPAYTPGKK